MQLATSSLKPVLNIACCQGVKLDWLYIESGDCDGCAVWEHSVAVNKQGVLFVAATFGGEEQEVVVLTLRKITPALVCFGHVYVPVDWLFENFPLSRRRCQPMVMEALRIVKVRARHNHNAHSHDSSDKPGRCSTQFSRAHLRKALGSYLSTVESHVQPPEWALLDVRI